MTKTDPPPPPGHWGHPSPLTGLGLSGGLLLVVLCLALLPRQPRPEGPPPPFREVLAAAAAGDGTALIFTGLLVLVGTPILRVAVLALGWGLSGNRRFLM